jgi:hypothetical protein
MLPRVGPHRLDVAMMRRWQATAQWQRRGLEDGDGALRAPATSERRGVGEASSSRGGKGNAGGAHQGGERRATAAPISGERR